MREIREDLLTRGFCSPMGAQLRDMWVGRGSDGRDMGGRGGEG